MANGKRGSVSGLFCYPKTASALVETSEAKYVLEALTVPEIYGQKSILNAIYLLIKALGSSSDSNLDAYKFAVIVAFG
jgi:hypothetical protein